MFERNATVGRFHDLRQFQVRGPRAPSILRPIPDYSRHLSSIDYFCRDKHSATVTASYEIDIIAVCMKAQKAQSNIQGELRGQKY